jgi:hypothetical protein
MLGVVMMSVVILNVIMLSEAASLEHFDRNFEKKNAEVENCQKIRLHPLLLTIQFDDFKIGF